MTLEEIKELIQVVLDTGVAELEVQRGDNRVRIRRTAGEVQHEIQLPAGLNAAPNTAPATATAHAAVAAPDSGLILVKSPIVGTYYDSPSPGSAAFVRPGDTVQPGQVLCIIESMKLMNEIEAEMAGVVVAKLVENASAVEYGESLFSIRPL